MEKGTWKAIENQHFDVGIYGVWYGANYGSVATYYALYRTIREMGYSVLMIDKPVLFEGDVELSPNLHSRVFARGHYDAIAPSLPLSEQGRYNEYCDTFLMGCDQVWNYGIAAPTGKTNYFDFVEEDKKKLSYASSFGHNTSFTPGEQLAEITKLFLRFDAISVREESAVQVLRSEFGVEGTQVLDPVFLLEQEEYDALIAESGHPENTEKFMLSYILDPTPEIRDHLVKAAEKKGLKLINLLDGRLNYHRNREIMNLPDTFAAENVSDWLWYFKNCEYVITDSFHGTSFALLFRKDFITLGNKQRGMARFESLVDLFGVRDRLVTEPEKLKEDSLLRKPVDFSRIGSIHEMEKTRSLAWLRKALALEKETLPTIQCVPARACSGCGACFNSCPVGAISMQPDGEGALYPAVDEEKCIRCRKCRRACPALHPKYDRDPEAKLYAIMGKDRVRRVSSSGGVFGLAAEQILQEGGVVCGAAFDEELQLRHQVIDSVKELPKLRGSKYLQSDTGRTYREIRAALEKGRQALFVGCPCQVAGLRTFLGKDYDNLYTMDLLCHGAPIPGVFQKYLEEVHGGRAIRHVGFRDKEFFGWSHEMTVKYRFGMPYRVLSALDLYYRAFTPRLAVRPHCQACSYARLPRQGDLTLGDFWGVEKYDPKMTDGKGTSLVSVNSGKGRELLEKLRGDLLLMEEVDREHVLKHGQPYAKPCKSNFQRTCFLRMSQHTSLGTAVQSCEDSHFDLGFLNLRADACGEILSDYVLYTAASRMDYSILAVKCPKERVREITPLKYRLVEFGNRYYPIVSSYDRLGNSSVIRNRCHGYLCRREYREMSRDYRTGEKSFVSYERLRRERKLVPVPFLEERSFYEKIAAGAPEERKDAYAAWYGNSAAERAEAERAAETRGLPLVDLTEDLPVEEWLSLLMHAALLCTDREDGVEYGVLFGRELYLQSESLKACEDCCRGITESDVKESLSVLRMHLPKDRLYHKQSSRKLNLKSAAAQASRLFPERIQTGIRKKYKQIRKW